MHKGVLRARVQGVHAKYVPIYVTALMHLFIPLPPAYTIQTLSIAVDSNI
jgi:hypothetical protein